MMAVGGPPKLAKTFRGLLGPSLSVDRPRHGAYAFAKMPDPKKASRLSEDNFNE